MSKLRCQGRTSIQEDRELECGNFNVERFSQFRMHCCLMDSGTWSWQSVISSLIQYHLSLYALSSSFTRKQGAICSEEPKPYIVSKILCFPLNSTAFNLETIPQSFSPKRDTCQSETHSTLLSEYYQICCVNGYLQYRYPDADPPLCIMG